MISCQSLGRKGRLGNQLFQYAFVRTAARRLGVPFYCPPWTGDAAYQLDDAAERAPEPAGIVRTIEENRDLRCTSCPVVTDGTDVVGYFQSPELFDRGDARRWFNLRPELAEKLLERHSKIDFSQVVGIHMRLGDYVNHPVHTLRHYVPPLSYYAAALRQLPRGTRVVLASDQPNEARKRLQPILKSKPIMLRRNSDYEDMFLLSRCRHLVLSPSTFSWWAAWLRPANADGNVFVPREGLFRPACQVAQEPEVVWHQPGWIRLRGMARFDWEYWQFRWKLWKQSLFGEKQAA